METRAQYVTIGVFVLLVLAAAFGFVYWLYRAQDNSARVPIDIVFPGSVTGLSTGGSVYFNGIRIGQVGSIYFAKDGSPTVVAQALVDPTAPLKKDVRATLGFQGLTGVAYLQLSGGSTDQPSLFDLPAGQVPKIYADRSAFEDILEGARETLKKADDAMSTVSQIIKQNGPQVSATIQNVQKFSGALADNSDQIAKFMQEAGRVADTLSGLSSRLTGVVDRVQVLVNEVKPEDVDVIVGNTRKFTDTLANVGGQIDQVVDQVKGAATDLKSFTEGLNSTLDDVRAVVKAVPAEDVKRIVANVTKLSDTLAGSSEQISGFISNAREAAGNIDKVAQLVIDRSQQVDDFVSSATSMVRKIDTLAGDLQPSANNLQRILAAISSDKVRSIVDNVQSLTGTLAGRGGDIDRAITDVQKAADSARVFADSLAAQRGKVDDVANEAQQMVAKLNAAADKVPVILDKVDAMVEGDGKGLIAEATGAARSIRQVAETIQSTLPGIMSGISRFSGNGLNDLTGAINQLRQTLSTIQVAVQGLERNPNRLLFGGSDQPVYSPQRR